MADPPPSSRPLLMREPQSLNPTIRRVVLALVLALSGAGALAQDLSEPRNNRIYAARAGQARIAVDPSPALQWQVVDEAGAVVRAWASSEPAGEIAVPIGGWYRLMLRNALASGEGQPIGGRFAVGMVVLITGQSQAEAFFQGSLPLAGAHPVGRRDPPQPPVTAVLTDCNGPRPYCAGDNTFWQIAPEGLGARLLLVALAERWRMPVGLVNAATGAASAAQLADRAQPAGNRLTRMAASAAPLSAAVIMGHGTTDAFFPTTPEAFDAAMATIVATLRDNGPPALPVLLSPLPPLTQASSSMTHPTTLSLMRDNWLQWLGLQPGAALDGYGQARAEAIRDAQRRLMRSLSLLDGGSLERVRPGLDGIHWSEAGVREAARVTAAALIRALPLSRP